MCPIVLYIVLVLGPLGYLLLDCLVEGVGPGPGLELVLLDLPLSRGDLRGDLRRRVRVRV